MFSLRRFFRNGDGFILLIVGGHLGTLGFGLYISIIEKGYMRNRTSTDREILLRAALSLSCQSLT